MGIFRKRRKLKETEAVTFKKIYQGKKDKDSKWQWVFWGLAISFICAVVLRGFYGVFRASADKNMSSPIENADNISWLYQNCYLLYRDLYNAQYGVQLDYTDLYLDVSEEDRWLLDEEYLSKYMAVWGVDKESSEILEDLEDDGTELKSSMTYEDCESLRKELESLKKYFQRLENYFRNLNNSYDYIIQDDYTKKYVTNMSTSDMDRGNVDQYFLLSFTFDSAGNVTIGDTICGLDESKIRKYANEVIREDILQNLTVQIRKFGKVKAPANCTITFAISKDAWTRRSGRDENSIWGGYLITDGYSFYYHNYDYGNVVVNAYWNSGISGIILLCLFGMFCLGFLLPMPNNIKPWRDIKVCSFPFEVLFVIGVAIYAVTDSVIMLIAYSASGRASNAVLEYLPYVKSNEDWLVGIFNLLVLTLFLFAGWYVGICARALRELGMIQYIKQRSLIYRFFPFVKSKVIGIYNTFVHLDLTQNAHRTILKLLFVNALILFFISCLWFGGIVLTVIYSLVLYVILRKYVSDLQEKYRVLFKAVDEIADGNLNVTITEDLGVFEPFRNEIFKIQEGLKKAVTMEVKSQRIKTELVTNMSHDLKTPLTAIITYVNLLKKEGVTEEQRREYLEILERKSLRLKSLIEDLFEFSKANSHNITLNIMDVDIMNLVKQVGFEMSDKINQSGLDVRLNLTEEKVILPLDSQKTYRIYENLFVNIAKYALPGTRVYVNGFCIDDRVVITLKNISAQEITVEASELTERFVRGNASRNTEGSGLGLAIAKSFMELQGGTLELEVDGDLFKVTTTWYVKEKELLGKGNLI